MQTPQPALVATVVPAAMAATVDREERALRLVPAVPAARRSTAAVSPCRMPEPSSAAWVARAATPVAAPAVRRATAARAAMVLPVASGSRAERAAEVATAAIWVPGEFPARRVRVAPAGTR
ncbi:hypothetical protein [Mesorhizobium sp. 8]|uniref:hypothetical protein n=1 Tax=Mesorhizobium sp. 8 TaxID=2584466 RepID=UPI0015D67722|nr:hypothetical protein [Mesorhizobium sp. 8]